MGGGNLKSFSITPNRPRSLKEKNKLEKENKFRCPGFGIIINLTKKISI